MLEQLLNPQLHSSYLLEMTEGQKRHPTTTDRGALEKNMQKILTFSLQNFS